MRIALFGPAFGHNIQPFLELFNNDKELEIDFYCHGENHFQEIYKELNFKPVKKNILLFLLTVKKYDAVWLMGGGQLLYVVSLATLLKKNSAKFVLHIWGEKLPMRSIKRNLLGRLTSIAMKRFDVINCNWFGTAEILKEKFKDKVQVNVLGLSDSYFSQPDKVDPEITKLLNQIDDKSYNFYYPKSFLSVSRHDLVVEAVRILKKEKLPPFKVYFIDGNAINVKRQKEIKDLIKKYKLDDTIILLNRVKYFDTRNFNVLWNKMDCGLQIAQHDQLSNTIFEPLINKKDLIISDILPYRFIEQYFGFKLDLTPLDDTEIASRMKNRILSIDKKNIKEREQIFNLIRERYLFKTNFNITLNKILDRASKL